MIPERRKIDRLEAFGDHQRVGGAALPIDVVHGARDRIGAGNRRRRGLAVIGEVHGQSARHGHRRHHPRRAVISLGQPVQRHDGGGFGHHQGARCQSGVVGLVHARGHGIAAGVRRRDRRPVVGEDNRQPGGIGGCGHALHRAVENLLQSGQRHRRRRLGDGQHARHRALPVVFIHGRDHCVGSCRNRRRFFAVIGQLDVEPFRRGGDGRGLGRAIVGGRQIIQGDRGGGLPHHQQAGGRAFIEGRGHGGGHRIGSGMDWRRPLAVIGKLDRQSGRQGRGGHSPGRAIEDLVEIPEEHLGRNGLRIGRIVSRQPQRRIAQQVVIDERRPREHVARQRPPRQQGGPAQRAVPVLQHRLEDFFPQIRRRSVQRHPGRGEDRHRAGLRALHQHFGHAVHRGRLEIARQAAERHHDRRAAVGQRSDVRGGQQPLRGQFGAAAVPRVIDDARAGVEGGEQRGARGRNGRRIQIDAAGHDKGILDQICEAGDRGREIAGGIPLVVRKNQLVLPIGAEICLVGLDFRDHRRQFVHRPRREPPDRHIGQIVAARIRQEFVGGENPVIRLAQHGGQVVGLGAHVAEEVVVPVAGQQEHLRRFRPVGRRIPHQGRNRLRRPLAAPQQVADIFEHGHAGPQALPGAVVRQVLRGRLQRPRRDHQIVDAVGLGQEPGVRRRRHRVQQRDLRSFDHRQTFIVGFHRPGLVRQGARGIGNPGGVARGIERQDQRIGEGGGGHRRRAGRAHDGHAGAGRETPVVLRRDAVHHEVAVVGGIGQHAAHGQHVGTVGGHAVGNGQHGRGGILVVEGDRARRRAVEREFRAVVRIPGCGLRPTLQTHPERHGAAGIPIQPQREIHPVRGGIGRADDGAPVIIVRGTLHRGNEG